MVQYFDPRQCIFIHLTNTKMSEWNIPTSHGLFHCVDIKLKQSTYPKELLPYRKACLSYFSRPIRPMLGFKGSQTWMNLFDHQPKTYAILIGSTVLVSVYILKQKDWDWPLRWFPGLESQRLAAWQPHARHPSQKACEHHSEHYFVTKRDLLHWCMQDQRQGALGLCTERQM